MQYINKKNRFPIAEGDAIRQCVEFVESSLKDIGVNKKTILHNCLAMEELLVELLAQNDGAGSIEVSVRKLLGKVYLSISVPGQPYEPYWSDITVGPEEMDELSEEEKERSIRGILLSSFGNSLKINHRRGKNRVNITVSNEQQSLLKQTVIGLVLGVVFGLILKFLVPQAGTDVIRIYLLSPIKTMFMNALNIIIAPVIFFSIVSCIAQFKDLSVLGKIGAKVMGLYLMTTVIAVTLANTTFHLLSPGELGFALDISLDPVTSVASGSEVDTSLLSTIINIVPSNFVLPFSQSDTLQIIFLAVIVGIAVGLTGEHANLLSKIFDACNALFLTLTTMIAKFIPLAVFCSVTMLIININLSTLFALLGVTGTTILTYALMIMIYGLLIFIFTRLNPLQFFKKHREGMITSFTLSSSSASMPTNINSCIKNLGISPKVCNFSIPLGATVNMDGCCIDLVIIGLFLAKAYGIEVPASGLISLSITIILLSLGAPGVPGTALVCLGVVLNTLGVPFEALGIIIGIYPFIDMFQTVNNTTGDVAVSLIVAKSENLLDTDVYNAPLKS